MPHPSSAFVRLLLRAYPRHLRQREADVLEAACIECLARERRRLGRFGAAYAWGRLIADTLIAAILLRADERRRRRVAWVHVPPSAPKEIPMTRLWQDVRYAARRLQRAPIFSLAVIATLALTIGATTPCSPSSTRCCCARCRTAIRAGWCCCSRPSRRCRWGFRPRLPGVRGARRLLRSIAAYRNREYELSGSSRRSG